MPTTTSWTDCFHLASKEHPDPHTEGKMCRGAIEKRAYDILWGVVNPGHAACSAVFRTKREADKYRREHAWAMVVVRVVVTPLYTSTLKTYQRLFGV